MCSSLSKTFQTAFGLFSVIAVAALMSVEARGQISIGTPLPAPPPLRFVPRAERSQLEAARDVKARVRLSVELAEGRLAQAEQMTTAQQYESAAKELGIYQGILEDALRFLKEQKEQKKLRDTYKRFEITLRSHGVRLETMRRSTPSDYAINIKMITDSVKDVRGEALNGFYGDDVMGGPGGQDEVKAPDDDKAKASSESATKERP